MIADHLGFIRDENFNLKDYIESQGEKFDHKVLEFEKIPPNLAQSSGQTAKEDTPKQEKVLDLETPDNEVIKDKKE